MPRRRSFAVAIFYSKSNCSPYAGFPTKGAVKNSESGPEGKLISLDFSDIFQFRRGCQKIFHRLGDASPAGQFAHVTLLLAHRIFHRLDSIARGGQPPGVAA